MLLKKKTKRKSLKKNKSKKFSFNKKTIYKLFLGFLRYSVVFGIWVVFISFVLVLYYSLDLPDISEISKNKYRSQITIRSDNGSVLAKYGDIRGKNLTYSQIPSHLIDAVIATEDRRFFNHWGVDIIGILRANSSNLLAGHVVQGGSTITQQLAKIAFLSRERTLKRKIQEVLLAIQLEYRFSKEQILSIYLNRVYMGKGVYGIDGAARYYFGKYAEYLSVFESAILAGMLKGPSKYNPATNHLLSLKRARQVMINMEDFGSLTMHEINNAKPPNIIYRGKARGILKEPYFSDYVREKLPYIIGNQKMDLEVYTTIDIGAQNILEKSITNNMKKYGDKYSASQASGIVMGKNGAIKAMMGGVSYDNSQFNRSIYSKRQAGSIFKLFVYLAGLENGYNINSIIKDKPITIKGWSPKNYGRRYYGNISFQDAFKRSINTVTVQISEKVGRKKVIDIVKRLGVIHNILPVPSIALGVTEMSLLEITNAYAHIANNGKTVKPFAITKVLDKEGNVIYSHDTPKVTRVLDRSIVADAKSLLFAAVNSGSGIRARLRGYNAYGKTGTTQKHRDAWFVGFRDDNLVAGIWVGNDDESHMKRATGSNLPAFIWKDVMENIK